MKKVILITLLMAAFFISCEKDETEPDTNPANSVQSDTTQTNPVDTTQTMDTTGMGTTVFKSNAFRQVTGTAQDFDIGHMYAQKWATVYSDSSNSEGVLRFDIRDPFGSKRLQIYFSGITSSTKTYNSSAGSGQSSVKLKLGEFVVEKIRLGSNMNYWWAPNNPHTAKLTISGDDVTVEIENFEIGGGLGSLGTETFNIKFQFDVSDYNALSDSALRLVNFK